MARSVSGHARSVKSAKGKKPEKTPPAGSAAPAA